MRVWSRIVILVALAAGACSPAPTTSPVAPAATSGPALADVQTLTIGYPNLASVLDPHAGVGGGGGTRRYDIFETLVAWEPSGKGVLPLLASKWESVDALTWRFTLRSDAIFQDNSKVTASDVAFSWARTSDPVLKSGVPGFIPTVATVTAIDPQTVEIKTKAPDPLFLKRIVQLAIVPKAYVEKVGLDEFAVKPVGSGPFKVKELRRDDRLILTGWMEHPYRKPKLTEITFRIIPEASARVQGMRTGDIDVTHQMSVEQGFSLKSDGFTVDYRPLAVYGTYLDTKVEGTPFADKRVRQAVNYAIDRDTLSKTVFRAEAKPVGVMGVEGAVGFNKDVQPYAYDVNKAKSLLASAGYANGFKVGLAFWAFSSEIQPSALYLQSQLKAIGIDVELLPTDITGYGDQLAKRKPPAPMFLDAGLQMNPFFDTERSWQIFWSEATSGNRYGNPEFDKLFVALREELDVAKREKLQRDTMALLQDDPPFLPLVTFNQVSGYNKTVKGIVPFSPDGDFTPFDLIYRTK